MSIEPLGGDTVYDGRIMRMRVERFRHADGGEVSREIVRSAGAVGIVAHDGARVWLVRQPRETVGDYLLELPAGRLDVEGEEPAAAARRELAEEIGKGARRWQLIVRYYSSAGFTDEEVHLFSATELFEEQADSGEEERIEVVPWPLERLAEAIAGCRDAKTLIGLLWLQRHLNG